MKSILLALTLLFSLPTLALINQANPPETDSGQYALPLRKMISEQSRDGQKVAKFVKATWDFAIQGGQTITNLTLSSESKLPKNAFVTRSYAYVVTTVTQSSGSTIGIAVTCNSTGDILSNTNEASHSSAGSFFDMAQTGAASAFTGMSTTGTCSPVVQFNTVTQGSTITAGKINFYIYYNTHE